MTQRTRLRDHLGLTEQAFGIHFGNPRLWTSRPTTAFRARLTNLLGSCTVTHRRAELPLTPASACVINLTVPQESTASPNEIHSPRRNCLAHATSRRQPRAFDPKLRVIRRSSLLNYPMRKLNSDDIGLHPSWPSSLRQRRRVKTIDRQ